MKKNVFLNDYAYFKCVLLAFHVGINNRKIAVVLDAIYFFCQHIKFILNLF